MPPAARISDLHVCGIPQHPPNPIVSGSGDTIVGFMPAARVGDSLVCGDSIVQGSGNVMINNKPAARIGDSTAHGGKIVVGFPTVIIGESGQSFTLKLAAKSGAPFCEECEKARKKAEAEAARKKAESEKAAVPPPDSVVIPPPKAKDPPPKPQVVLKGVAPETVALAAKKGDSQEQRKARSEVARAFYMQNGEEWVTRDKLDDKGRPIFVDDDKTDPDGVRQTVKESFKQPISKAHVRSHNRGIDFSKPVSFGPQPKIPKDLVQWQAEGGRQGSYYSGEGTTCDELGIHHSAAGKGQEPVKKITKAYKMHDDTPFLKSTSGPIHDHWSVYRRLHHSNGGGTQYYVPETKHAQKA